MENTMDGAAAGGAVLAVTFIWIAVYLGFFVWYLWSMARLLARLGFPNWTGWVPVWNEWNLLVRGGYPGWIALLVFVPFGNLVFVVVRIMAVHRINTEHGKGVGFTVMGALIAPLWATLLGSAIGSQGQWPSAGPTAPAQPNPYASQIPGVQVQHVRAPGYGQQAAPQTGASQQGAPPQPGRYGAPEAAPVPPATRRTELSD